MAFDTSPFPPPHLIYPKRFTDHRGWLSEHFRASDFTETFVQDNCSWTGRKGTIRGLHYQREPHAHAKLVRCLKGRILDVAADLREGSPDYGSVFAYTLSEEGGEALLVPKGFAHGFCTLTDDVLVTYKLDGYFAPEFEAGVAWDDPDLAIPWPVSADEAILSARDRALPRLRA